MGMSQLNARTFVLQASIAATGFLFQRLSFFAFFEEEWNHLQAWGASVSAAGGLGNVARNRAAEQTPLGI
jgi:hypothetical protein